MYQLNNDYTPGKMGWHYLDSVNTSNHIRTRHGFGWTAALCLIALLTAFGTLIFK